MKYTDQTGYTIELEKTPERIISLVPSQSELLWDLGLQGAIKGITKFCIHPDAMYQSIDKIGGTKNCNIAKIRKLQPDLIIGNKEENNQLQIELLRKEFKVWTSDINHLNDALQMMMQLGVITGKLKQAEKIVKTITETFGKINNGSLKGKTVAYFIWKAPYMVAASNTFIHSVLGFTGLINVFSSHNRYPIVNESMIKLSKPDFIFLSSEPYPFTPDHYLEFQNLCPDAEIVLVDGEMFSWYGSRLLSVPNYLDALSPTQ